MKILKSKKFLLSLVFFVILYFVLSFIVTFSAFSIGEEIYELSPSDLGISFEEIQIESDNSYISTWWVPSSSETTVIMLHGLRSQKASPEMLEKIKIFNDIGLSVIAIDFRNHGLSGEGNFTFGIDEINDVYTAVNYFYENEGLKSFGIWGFSYGATTALFAGLEFYNQTSNVELLGIFAESPYLDLLEVFTDQVAYRTPLNKTMANLLKPGTIFLTNLVFDFDFNSIKKTFGNKNEVSFPTVVVSCAKDLIVPPSQSRKIAQILGLNASYQEFEKCNSHGRTLNSEPERYRKILENLFN